MSQDLLVELMGLGLLPAICWHSHGFRGCVQEAIQEKIDSGVIQLFTKQWGAKKPEDPVGQPGFGLLEVRKAQAKHEGRPLFFGCL